ncbi:hypothetical protein KO501_16540 [Alteromonas sp. C1M14]|nr:hypothetical protein [Alteromonas sp. C1M14]
MNNVVIFAMLIMIALFNIDQFLPQQASQAIVPLVPTDAYILKIEQGQNQLVRQGQSWQQVASSGDIKATPQAQLRAWQQAVLESTTMAQGFSEEPLIVVVWLAGQSDGQVFAFYPQPEATYVRHNDQWFTLANTTLTQLLPWNIN